MHLLGEITLNLSTIIYLIWFIPQIKLTFQRKSTEGLSLLMHACLLISYMADFFYGFGLHMPLQYRFVTIVGLVSLGIEHCQFARYGLKKQAYWFYSIITLIFSVAFILIIFNLATQHYSRAYYDIAGFVSMLFWNIFMVPQIVKNFMNKSTTGLSTQFVLLALLTGVLDTISAYALNWDLPNKINAPLGLIGKLFVLAQCYYYQETTKTAQLIEPSLT